MRAVEFMDDDNRVNKRLTAYRAEIEAEQEKDTVAIAAPSEQIRALYKTGEEHDAKRADAIVDALTRWKETRSSVVTDWLGKQRVARLVADIQRRKRDEDRHNH